LIVTPLVREVGEGKGAALLLLPETHCIASGQQGGESIVTESDRKSHLTALTVHLQMVRPLQIGRHRLPQSYYRSSEQRRANAPVLRMTLTNLLCRALASPAHLTTRLDDSKRISNPNYSTRKIGGCFANIIS
jgi:hypothetical protein